MSELELSNKRCVALNSRKRDLRLMLTLRLMLMAGKEGLTAGKGFSYLINLPYIIFL